MVLPQLFNWLKDRRQPYVYSWSDFKLPKTVIAGMALGTIIHFATKRDHHFHFPYPADAMLEPEPVSKYKVTNGKWTLNPEWVRRQETQ